MVEEESADDGAAVFITRWQLALNDPERQWPYAYLNEDGEKSAVHFNPMTITAVAVKIME